MGGLCAGALPSPPEIDISAEQIGEAVSTAVEEIPKKIEENREEYKKEVDKCGDDGKFEVPDTTIVLTKASTEDEIKSAAIANAFADQGRTQVKDQVWGVLEPTIDEQLNQAEGVPQKLKNVAKDKFREATVDPAVDKALDQALEKAKGGASE